MPNVRYSVTLGYLEAAARQDPLVDDAYRFQRHVVYQAPGASDRLCEALLEEFEAPSVVAFSIYFWNRAVSLRVAESVKQRWPACTVVVGGNDVSHQAPALFAESSAVDVLVHGEGELRFVGILRALLDGSDLSVIPGISYRSPAGRIDTPAAERIADLSQVPSPLLSGVYDPEDISASRMIVYETNRGCPYSCAFCYWGGATNSRVRLFPMERVEAELAMIVRHAPQGGVLFIADANFGLWPRDEEITELIIDLCARERKTLIVMTNWAKKTNDRVLEMATKLHRAGLTGAITLSAQSFNQETLDIANRSNIRIDQYRRLQARFLERGVPTYTDLIWGMPGETVSTFMDGIEECLEAGGSPVIYPLVLLNNTEYTTARFRRAHDLRTRRLPSDLSTPELVADVVVGHGQMSEEDWLFGLQLRMALCIYYKALLRATLWYLHVTTGVRFVDLLARLRTHLFEETDDPVVTAILSDYRAGVVAPDSLRIERAAAIVGPGAMLEDLHLQAVLHRHVAGAQGVSLTRNAARALLEVVSPAGPQPPREEFESVVDLDLAAAKGLRARTRRQTSNETFDVSRSVWSLLRSSGQLPLGMPEASGPRVRGTVDAPPDAPYFGFSPYAVAIVHGTNHPLRDAVLRPHTRGQHPAGVLLPAHK